MFDEFLNSFPMEPGIWPICLRLLCAMLVGMVIGTEREYTNRPAGMRTHILVALGACVVALTGQMLRGEYGNADPARLAAQVITGVGFLGAGTIMREGATVKGLTTAASVWTVACLGIAAGFGYYAIALMGMVFMLVTLTILELLQHHLPGRKAPHEDYALETADVAAALALINEASITHRAHLRHILAKKQEDGTTLITFETEFHGVSCRKRQERFFAELASAPVLGSIRRGCEYAHL
jgi:putative Mg2+ transporter-C (MgtC) family protein